MEKATRITVQRLHPDTLGARYPITVSLDGERMAHLFPGQAVSREVAPGRHRLRAYNTLVWKTVRFDVRAGEHLGFVTGNRSNLATMLFAVLGAGVLSVTLERAAPEDPLAADRP
ncbi:MAG: hypothetical protein HYY35_05920 [Deltaproteobacteria bacterium]|nr:hypothetical protein [Deltaproteobacteria bacterium]